MQRYALIIWATIRNRGDAYTRHDYLHRLEKAGVVPMQDDLFALKAPADRVREEVDDSYGVPWL